MQGPINSAILIIFATALSGCSSIYNQAAKMQPVGSDFHKELHAGYVKLAGAELDELDFTDTKVFSARAIRAGKGETVPPEAISRRKLPFEQISIMTTARNRLVATLNEKTRARHPKAAAQSQIAFECWMQELEENIQPDEIAACRDRFNSLIASIETKVKVSDSRSKAKVMATRPLAPPVRTIRPAAAMKREVLEQTSYVVLFKLNSAGITETAKRILDDAIAAAKRLGAAVIRIAGHTDRSGNRAYNAKLSERRTDKVSNAFADAGIDGSTIRIESHGEDKPAVATADEKVEPLNRRVEINIITGGARTAKLR